MIQISGITSTLPEFVRSCKHRFPNTKETFMEGEKSPKNDSLRTGRQNIGEEK